MGDLETWRLIVNRYLTFQCVQHPVPASEEDETQGSGGLLARRIADAVVTAGAKAYSKNPVFGEGGWSFRFGFDRARINLFLNVADLECLERETWCVALIPRPKGMFGRALSVPEQLMKIVETTVRELGASDLHWWTADEFESSL